MRLFRSKPYDSAMLSASPKSCTASDSTATLPVTIPPIHSSAANDALSTNAAKIRTSTELLDNNIVGWPSEGKVLNVTGESTNWYRITYPVNGEDQTCYVAKTVVADAAVLDAFTAIENGEEVEVIVAAVNVRSYPSADSTASIRGTLAEGTKVTRVAVSENWSRILYEVVSETETDENGEAKVEYKQYYVSNDCLKVVGATETVEETVAETTADAE